MKDGKYAGLNFRVAALGIASAFLITGATGAIQVDGPSLTVLDDWSRKLRATPATPWDVLLPHTMTSTGGSQLTLQADHSWLAGGANPQKDIYEIPAHTEQTGITSIQLECLTDPSLPGGGPGRHSNSNFVLSRYANL